MCENFDFKIIKVGKREKGILALVETLDGSFLGYITEKEYKNDRDIRYACQAEGIYIDNKD